MRKDLALTRRDMLAGLGAGGSALVLPRVSAADAPKRASGTVYDASGGDLATSARCGIPGVMVSNGRDVALSDANGHWSLTVRDGDVIFLIKPAGFACTTPPGAAGGWYLHQPDGTPAHLALAGEAIAPTGPLPETIDFALVRSDEPRRFEVLLAADTQPANERELHYAGRMIDAAMARCRPAFALSHGDVMADDLSLLPAYIAMIARTGIAWFHSPGNHDMNFDAPTEAHAFETWKRYLGPTCHALNYGGATFILLNNVAYASSAMRRMGGPRYVGRIGADQLRFVRNVLRHTPCENLVVVSMHIPLESFDNPRSASDTTEDRGALLEILSSHPHSVSFAGHSHTTEHHYLGAGYGFGRAEPHHHHVLTAVCGSWWSGPSAALDVPLAVSRDGSPKGFHVLSVDGNAYTTRFESFEDACDGLARIYDGHGSGEIVADVFDGGPRTEVLCEIDGAPRSAITLSRRRYTDRYAARVFAEHAGLCKPWVSAAPSSHIFAADLPPPFALAAALRIRIVDEYGRRHERVVRRALATNEKGAPNGTPSHWLASQI